MQQLFPSCSRVTINECKKPSRSSHGRYSWRSPHIWMNYQEGWLTFITCNWLKHLLCLAYSQGVQTNSSLLRHFVNEGNILSKIPNGGWPNLLCHLCNCLRCQLLFPFKVLLVKVYLHGDPYSMMYNPSNIVPLLIIFRVSRSWKTQ